ncbi:hypothetical protein SDRG_10732 [Saprolegnia diclina VS20]|uniref:Uncharacterized protein n=1 Tax=Saprolegnia diclina (strain VS20) TaxID=1156394 RepID=T0QDC5_SAPDV|nr:hypothetical protein SDRG_10732 [Saprolegnia diclina VS20]EQC31560.1 hypothetical protein SDRG_10732 [Saprolegnia diclina VS20]|eukprot:XP_008614959.1 hypothetical protein SDRG_10732 [Saprolegnia diclina VS20]
MVTDTKGRDQHAWPRREYTKPWLASPCKPPSSHGRVRGPATDHDLCVTARIVEPQWNSSPPEQPRILKHQLLCKSPPPSSAHVQGLFSIAKTTATRADKDRSASKPTLLALRRQVETRLAQDRDEERRGKNEWWWASQPSTPL